jgi:hypothetical protein
MLGSSWVAAQLAASQEGLSTMSEYRHLEVKVHSFIIHDTRQRWVVNFTFWPHLRHKRKPLRKMCFDVMVKSKWVIMNIFRLLRGSLLCMLKLPLGNSVNLWSTGPDITAKLLALLLHSQRSHTQILTWRPYFLIEIIHDFPQFLHAYAWRSLKLCHNRFLSRFQSIVHWSS